jgi:hypothetical protein
MAQEYVKISELDLTPSFGTADHFVIVQNDQTVKINGTALIQSLVTLTNLATRSYVDAVVDSAPGTLDTLRELAAALNDDANFGSTITTLINQKLSIGNFGLEFLNQLATVNTYHIAEGSNLYFTEQRVLDIVNPLLINITANTLTASELNVQNINFTGTGAVTINSGNDLNFAAAGDITFNGELAITATQLKSIVAASADFTDFKARISAL